MVKKTVTELPRSYRPNCCDPRDDDADHGRDERGEVGVEVPEGGRCVARIAQSRGLPIVVTDSCRLAVGDANR